MANEIKIEAPMIEVNRPGYDQECRSALRPAFEKLLDIAMEAGWDRTRAAYELMYLASHSIAEERDR